jgi:hypothetical protein
MLIYLSLKLDTRRVRSNKTYPIVVRLSYAASTSYIATGHSCLKSQCNTRLSKLNKYCEDYQSINPILNAQVDTLRKDISQIVLEVVNNIKQLKQLLSNKKEALQSVVEYWLSEIERLKFLGKHGNARSYKSVLSGVKKYMD